MKVRYLGPSEYERARLRERVAEAIIREHVAVTYPSVVVDSLRVDVLRGDAGATAYTSTLRFRDGTTVSVAGVIDEQGRASKVVVR